MAIYLQYVAMDGSIMNLGKGKVHAMRHGSILVSPGNLYAISTPRDTSTGQGSGKRQYEPITIVKEVDIASPLLFSAAANHKVFATLKLNFVKTSPQGITRPCFTITLTDAALVDYTRNPFLSKPRKSGHTHELEEFALTFQKIEVSYTGGGVSNSDDWSDTA